MEEEPKTFRAIMVSSTFTDLEAHRREVIDAIHRLGFHANVMEYSGARSDGGVIEASLRMVRQSAAYLCVIGHKYGQTPVDADHNPNGLSITELEFNEARRLGKPILLFLMTEDHPGTRADFQSDTKKNQRKLEAFRKQAKRIDPDKATERIYDTFASKDEFAKKAAIAVGLQAIQVAGGSDLPDRAIRDAIARFVDVRPEANQAELTEAIESFETGYRALEQQLAAITVSDNRVTSLKADAEAALAEGDLDKARAAYRDAADAAREKAVEPVRTAADLKAAEAGAHLLALDWEAADAAWAEAAVMLAPFDPRAAEGLAEEANDRLMTHGRLYAGAGPLNAAIDRRRALAAAAHARGDERETARLRNNLGNSLRIKGERTGDPEGLHVLEEAVTAYRDALSVYTRAGMPIEWAMTQNNLGIVLRVRGDRTDDSEGLCLIDQAVTAYREALTVYTHAEMPAKWALVQNNLGNALATQARRTDEPECLHLLDQAVTAYRDALIVRTRADMPVQWASTQNNLGIALWSQGVRTGDDTRLRLFNEAVTAFHEALAVRTRANMPVDWAMTQENIGLAFESLAKAEPDGARSHLLDAEAALVAALGIYTPEHMAFYHSKATRTLADIREKLAALDA